MPKRKHIEISDAHTDDRALNIKCSRLKAKVDQGNKTLATALKFARGFERQKLGRRQKTASTKNEHRELLRLREEVIVLKELDLGDIASNYLFKQIARTKRIKESPAFVTMYGEEPKIEGPKNGAEANVTGRLFNSNPVKEVLPGIMKDIYGILSIDVEGKENENLMRSKDEKILSATNKMPSRSIVPMSGRTTKDSDNSIDDQFLGFSDESGRGDDDDDNDRVIGSSDEEGSGNSNELKLDASLDTSPKAHTRPNPQLSLSPSPSPSSDVPPLQSQSKSAIKDPSTSGSRPTFIPSLLMGGYYSGSESGSDIDDTPNTATTGPHKNRRGQRARQRIAEAKFGAGAKHLAHQTKARSRDSGWDSKRGATDSRGTSKVRPHFGHNRHTSNGKGPTGANGDVLGSRGKPAGKGGEKEGSVHPSWEAARKKKEQTSLAKGGFMGKKITFD